MRSFKFRQSSCLYFVPVNSSEQIHFSLIISMSLNVNNQLFPIVRKIDTIFLEKLFGKRNILRQNSYLIILILLFNLFIFNEITRNWVTLLHIINVKSDRIYSWVEGRSKLIWIELLNLEVFLNARVRGHFHPIQKQL